MIRDENPNTNGIRDRDVMGSASHEGNLLTVKLTIWPDELARLKTLCADRGTGLSAYIATAAMERLRKDEEA